MKCLVTSCLALGAACAAHAQTATVQVSHDRSGGVVLPGETIRVTARITWTPFMQWAGLKGNLEAESDLGVASGIGSDFFHYQGPLVSFGVPVGGSVKGVDIASIPGFFSATWPIPFGNWNGVNFLWYDWTAPSVTEPRAIAFDFVADPIAPNVRLYPTQTSPAFVEAQTTYIGTSILVLPAPGGVLIIGAAGLASARRRRAPG